MDPIKVKRLPLEYKLDKELMNLISEANLKFGEYKSNLKTVNLIQDFFRLYYFK